MEGYPLIFPVSSWRAFICPAYYPICKLSYHSSVLPVMFQFCDHMWSSSSSYLIPILDAFVLYTWGKCPFILFLCFWRSLSLRINMHLLPSVPFTFPQRNVGCNLLPHPSHGEPLLPSWSVLAEILFPTQSSPLSYSENVILYVFWTSTKLF